MFPLPSLSRSLGFFLLSIFFTLLFSIAGVSSSTACTPKIVYIDDDQPSFIEAGTSITLSWEVQNQSSCDAEDLRLGFYSDEPESGSADYGGDNHPSFSLSPWETGFIEVNIVSSPEEVDTEYKVYFDILTSDGTPLDPLALGRLYAQFTVTAPPAEPTTLLSPANNATIDTETPTLQWESVDNATVYRVVLSENISFSGLDDDGSGTTSCIDNTCQTITTNSENYQVESGLTVEFGKTYYWMVRDDASGDWSSVFRFTVEEDIPPSNCTARFSFVDDGDQPDEVAPGSDVDLTWEIKNTSDCDAVGYHLGFNSADPSSSTADYGGSNHQSFTIRAGDTGFVEANIRNTPEEEGDYRVEFDIYTNEDELLPASSGGLTLFSEFTVTGEEEPEPPPTECTPHFAWVEDGYQPSELEPGVSVDFTWKVQNTSDCDAEGYHLGFYVADPSSSTA
ncbi:MAG: hypothetical protein D3916_12495, partial [Candidatus Electrothrix sp. MAN1_4]|nr:hypothetical protein [Candidatus Electrothrix sp. MAN1_4]